MVVKTSRQQIKIHNYIRQTWNLFGMECNRRC